MSSVHFDYRFREAFLMHKSLFGTVYGQAADEHELNND